MRSMPRATILHADLDAFFASVEQRDDPALRDRPVIVGGGGVVLAASYEAKARGVRTAMPGSLARRMCPEAVVVPPRMEAYVEASRATFAIFEDTTPLVEGISIDEAFLDVGGLGRVSGSPVEIARRLRAEVRERVGLTITVGVARTKFLAKVASGMGKPDGLLVVEPHEERAFLHPLPVERLWGVGPKTTERLHRHGIGTVGELAAVGEEGLVAILGRAAGRHLYALSQLRDPRPVRQGPARKSIGAQRAMGQGPHSRREVEVALLGLVDRVTRRLRKAERQARTVTVGVRFGDRSRASRATTLTQPTDHTATILAAAEGLLGDHWPAVQERGITLVGVSLSNLGRDDGGQLGLPFGAGQPAGLDERVDRAIDLVRERFGVAALRRASVLEDRAYLSDHDGS